MDYFDKKINELYNQPEKDVPNDLSWDYMEDGIYSRMDEKKPRRKALWFWISGGMVAIALVVLSVTMFNAEEKNSNFATNNNTVNKTNNPSKINTPQSTKSSQLEIEKTESKNSEKETISEEQTGINITERTSNISQSKAISESDANLKNQSHKIQSKTIEYTKSSDDQRTSIIDNFSIVRDPNLSIFNTNKIIVLESPKEEPRGALNFDQLATLAINTFDSPRKKITSNIEKISISNKPIKIEDKRNTKYAFSILGGTSLHSGFNIQDNTNTSSLPGYSIRLGLSAEDKNGWGYEFGIGHSLLVEKFDFEKTDTVSMHHDDIVVGHLTNSLTGTTTNVIGDAYRDSSRSRRELIYNTINLLTIDAAIYRRIYLSNKWSIVPSAGVQYDRILSIGGKSLDANDEIFPYDNNSEGISKNLLSIKLGIGIDYALTNRLSLSVRANSAISFNNLYSNGKRLGTTFLQGGLNIKL